MGTVPRFQTAFDEISCFNKLASPIGVPLFTDNLLRIKNGLIMQDYAFRLMLL